MSTLLGRLKSLFRRERSIRTVIYGVQSTLADEAQLVRDLNEFLKAHEAGKVRKEADNGSFNPDDGSPIPPRIEYSYSGSSGKSHPGWFFKLEPNVGVSGKAKIEGATDCAWLLYAGQRDAYNKTPGYHEIINDYIKKLLASITLPTRVLYTYEPRAFN